MLGHFQSHALNGYAPVAGATVTVTNELTGALAILRSDFAGTVPKVNGAGFTTASDGHFDFFTTGGFYRVVVEKDGSSKTWTYVPIGTLQAYDFDALLGFKRVTVRAASTGNITIATALNNGDVLDGVTLATDDLTLVPFQTTKSQNAIIKVAASPARAPGYTTWNDYVGLLVAVTSGTVNANTLWIGTNNPGGTIDSTDLIFTKLTVAGGNAPLDNPSFTGSMAWSGDISPAQITADQDNYNPTGASGAAVIRHDLDAERSINGHAGGADGRLMIDVNTSSKVLRLPSERASSSAANRVAGSDVELDPGAAGLRIYDATSQRWRPVGYRRRPLHLECAPDPVPAVPHKPTLFADWSTMPWLDRGASFQNSSGNRSALSPAGRLVYVAAGVPAFTTLYESGHSGYQSAPSRTNLLTKSSAFDHANWVKSGLSVTADAIAGPDGNVVADKLVETNTNSEHLIQQDVSGLNTSNPYTQSILVSPAQARTLRFSQYSVPTVANSAHVYFSPATGAFSGALLNGAAASQAYDKEVLSNGWWRVFMRAVLGGSETTITFRYGLGNPGGSYLGDGASGLYVYGAQAEGDWYPTPYIPTDAAQVTRAASRLTITPPAELISATEHTLVWEGVLTGLNLSSGVGGMLLEMSDGTTANRFGLFVQPDRSLAGFVFVGGVAQTFPFTAGNAISVGVPFKCAVTLKAGAAALSINGGAPIVATPAAIPASLSRLDVATGATGGQPSTSVTKRLLYFPRYIFTHIQALSA
jgi:hypothetical protein